MLERVRSSGEFIDNMIVSLLVIRDYHSDVVWLMEAGVTINDDDDDGDDI